jgi:hypothetical protein
LSTAKSRSFSCTFAWLMEEVMNPTNWPAAARIGARTRPSGEFSSSSSEAEGPRFPWLILRASASSAETPTIPAMLVSKMRAPEETFLAKISRPPRTKAISMLSEPMSSSSTVPASFP